MSLEFVAIDYETYWDSDFTLKKLSTSEYLRDPRFDTHCAVVLRQSEDFKPRFIRRPDLAAYHATLPWDNMCYVAHHAHFDGAITAWKYGYYPKQYFCTMSASQFWNQGATRHGMDKLAAFYKLPLKTHALALTKGKRYEDLTDADWAELEPYTIRDGRNCLYFLTQLWDKLTVEEREAMDLTIRMFTRPLLEVNLDLAREALADAKAKKAEKINAVEVTEELLRKGEKFAQLLRDLGVDPPMKPSPKNPQKLIYAFAKKDEAFLELLEHPDERVRMLAEAKQEASSNIDLTRAQRLINSGERGALPVYLKFAAAGPHRWAGGDKMNLQNLRRGSKLRRSIVAPKGHVIVVADAAQIEPRFNGWHAFQEDLIELFRRKEDPYNDMATSIYNRVIDRKKMIIVDGKETYPEFLEGFVGKTAFLGLGYRMGWKKFKQALAVASPPVEISDEEAQRIVNGVYRIKNYKIAESWVLADEWLLHMITGHGRIVNDRGIEFDADEKRIWLPSGTSMHYPGLTIDEYGEKYYIKHGQKKFLHGGVIIENIIQKLSRDKIRDDIITIAKEVPVTCMTHDEAMALAKESEAKQVLQFVLDTMSKSPSYAPDLPLAATGGYDYCYSK